MVLVCLPFVFSSGAKYFSMLALRLAACKAFDAKAAYRRLKARHPGARS
jgi:hypothetical protein